MDSTIPNPHKAPVRDKGFALVSALLLVMILTVIAAAMVYTTMTESKISGSDREINQAQYAAEAALEKMTSDLGNLFAQTFAPTTADLQAIAGSANMPGSGDFPTTVYYNSSVTFPGCSGSGNTSGISITGANAGECYEVVVLNSGPNKGLTAQVLPIQLNVTATLPSGTTTSMSRTVQVAMIPVFQFGAFSSTDMSFNACCDMQFAGNIHANGNLFLLSGAGSTLTFYGMLSAHGQVMRDVMANGVTAANSGHSGKVLIPINPGGCDGGTTPGANCRYLNLTGGMGPNGAEASCYGGLPGACTANPQWGAGAQYLSGGAHPTSVYSTMLVSGTTGGQALSLPFVQGSGNVDQHQILAPASATDSSALSDSKLYNMATIRVTLADTEAQLPYCINNPGTCNGTDPDNVPLGNAYPTDSRNTPGYYVSGTLGTACSAGTCDGATATALGSNAGTGATTWNTTYWAQGMAQYQTGGTGWTCCQTGYGSANSGSGASSGVGVDPDWQNEAAGLDSLVANHRWVPMDNCATATPATTPPFPTPGCATVTATPMPTPAYLALPTSNTTYTWPLITGYLRVEVRQADGTYQPVTQKWLEQGFARGLNIPTGGPGTNPVHPNAILLFQQIADHWDTHSYPTSRPLVGKYNAYNWFPINFYDPREGELRDLPPSSLANAKGTTAWNESGGVNGIMNAVELDVANLQAWLNSPSAPALDTTSQNGYILYFSDRRNSTTNDGTSALEDVINSTNSNPATNAAPNGVLDSPSIEGGDAEDVNGNGVLDNSGAFYMGYGFGFQDHAGQSIWNDRTSMMDVGRKYHVTGPRHVLRLVNGGLGSSGSYLPHTTTGGGFTVASENPVYVVGPYNATSTGYGPNTCPGASAQNLTPGAAWASTCAVPASIVTDAVTVLSHNWSDYNMAKSMINNPNSPASDASRTAATEYFRMALAMGKNKEFQQIPGADADNGTDGGQHNFMRMIENWSGDTLNYSGSMVSLFYAEYATGVFKNNVNPAGQSIVYGAPTRDFAFDINFTNFAMLPPGTPHFVNVNNVGFAQNYTPQ